MTWETPDRIFDVLNDKKLSTSQIIKGLESIGCGESYRSVSGHLRKLTQRKQLQRERIGREFHYWNDLMYKEDQN